MEKKAVIFVIIAMLIPLAAGAQGDPLMKLFQKTPPVSPQPSDLASALCPKGRECVLVEGFTKADYKGEVKRFQVAGLTGARGFDRLVVHQHITGEHGVIINTIKVKQGGRWAAYSQGLRLQEGRTEFPVPVPAGTEEIVISFDHGRGAELKVILERQLP